METVKQNTTKYKILFIFSFLLLTLLLFNTNVFASFTYSIDGTQYTIPDTVTTSDGKIINTSDYNHIVAYGYNSRNGVYTVLLHNSDTLQAYDVSGSMYKFNTITNWCRFVYNDGSFTYNDGKSSVFDAYLYDFLYSDLDIYSPSGELVFQAPVQGNLTLAQVLEKTQEEIPKLTLAEIAKIVTLILVVVVSLVGFRKAWKLLRTSLNQS